MIRYREGVREEEESDNTKHREQRNFKTCASGLCLYARAALSKAGIVDTAPRGAADDGIGNYGRRALWSLGSSSSP